MFKFRSIEECSAEIKDQRVLMRVDFNVPMKGGVITNTQRIDGAIPTIKCALAAGAKSIVLMSHMGRPAGNNVEKLSLKPVAEALKEKLGMEIVFLNGE